MLYYIDQLRHHRVLQIFNSLDFRFYEDPSDEYRDNSQGTCLPLWTFNFDKAKKLEITGLCWTPSYTDLFIASFGSCRLKNFCEILEKYTWNKSQLKTKHNTGISISLHRRFLFSGKCKKRLGRGLFFKKSSIPRIRMQSSLWSDGC